MEKTTEQLLAEATAQLKKNNEVMERQEREIKTLGKNMKWLRSLVEEQVALTEQTSGLVVEHITSLDGRMNETGLIFANRIKRGCEKLLGSESLRKLNEAESGEELAV